MPSSLRDLEHHTTYFKKYQGTIYAKSSCLSATIISMAIFRLNLILGIFFLILSLVIALCRVLGGVHYPRDVMAGFLVGIVCGLLLFLFSCQTYNPQLLKSWGFFKP